MILSKKTKISLTNKYNILYIHNIKTINEMNYLIIEETAKKLEECRSTFFETKEEINKYYNSLSQTFFSLDQQKQFLKVTLERIKIITKKAKISSSRLNNIKLSKEDEED